MSVTFFAENAPQIPDGIYDNRDGSFDPHGPKIIITTATPYELNVANGNAGIVLEMLGLKHKYYNGPEDGWDLVGCIEVADLEAALHAVNLWGDAEGSGYVDPIRDLLLYCIAENYPLVWS